MHFVTETGFSEDFGLGVSGLICGMFSNRSVHFRGAGLTLRTTTVLLGEVRRSVATEVLGTGFKTGSETGFRPGL